MSMRLGVERRGGGTTVRSLVLSLVGLSMMVLTPSAAGAAAPGTVASGSPAMFGMGDNSWGQLGVGYYDTSEFLPVAARASGPLAGKTVTQSVSTFQQQTCVIASGEVFCFGNGDAGRFGAPAVDGLHAPFVVPVPVYAGGALAGKNATDLSANDGTVCAVAGGAAYCWGDGSYGILGTGETDNRLEVPVPVDQSALAGRSVQQISVGQRSACLAADGKAFCWGSNQFSQLGTASPDSTTVPTAVDDSGALKGRYVTDVVVGDSSACALASGRAFCWGLPETTGSGRDSFADPVRTPVAVDTTGVLAGRTVTEIATGGSRYCVLADGYPYCWGSNGRNGLADGVTDNVAFVPTKVRQTSALAGTRSTDLVMGANHACVLASGTPVCWGDNFRGQLGVGRDIGQSFATAVRTDGALAGRTVVGLGAGWTGDVTLMFTGTPRTAPPPTPAPDPGPTDAAHRPRAALDSVSLFGALITVQGWAFDPDDPTAPTGIRVTDSAAGVVGRTLEYRTGASRPDVASSFPYVGTAAGFAFQQHLAGSGPHTVCVTAVNSGRGSDTDLGCRVVEVPPTSGAIDVSMTRTGVMTAAGWAGDPDHPGRPVDVEVVATGPDGVSQTLAGRTDTARADVLAAVPWVGYRSGWSIEVPVTVAGDHQLCLRVRDIDTGERENIRCTSYTVRNAFGSFDQVALVRPPGQSARVSLEGWVIDPNLPVGATGLWRFNMDGGVWSQPFRAPSARSDVAAAFPGQGANHGLGMTSDIAPGTHTFCVSAIPTGGGATETALGCHEVVVPVDAPDPAGTYVAVTPQRIVDTRQALGVAARLGADEDAEFAVAGLAGVPSTGVSAVVLNVTVTDPTATGHLTTYQAGTTRPDVSNLNFVAGQTVPNLVTVPVGPDGRVVIHHGGPGSTELIVDTVGYYQGGTPRTPGALVVTQPQRVLDTRTGANGVGQLASEASVRVPVGTAAGIPAGRASAVVANLTVVDPTSYGNLSVYAGGRPRPATSNLNFEAGQTLATMVIVPVGDDGSITVTNDSPGSSHVLVDIVGYYLAGTPVAVGAFVPVAPARIADSRVGQSVGTALGAGEPALIQVSGASGVSGFAGSVVATVTAVDATAPGNFVVYGRYGARPGSSNVNFAAGGTSANTAFVPASDRDAWVHNDSSGSTQVVVDVYGYFLR